MNIDAENLWRDIQEGEDFSLELKEVNVSAKKVVAPHRDLLADELAAFANADGGRIVLGRTVSRNTQSLTTEQIDLLMPFVRKIYSDQIKLPLRCNAFRVKLPNPTNDRVLAVDIPKSLSVHESPGGFFDRFFDTKNEWILVQFDASLISEDNRT